MKSISANLNTHLDGEVTTLCVCWRIVRRDGAVFAFTGHDQDLTINGVTYESQHGFSATAISGGSDLSVDNLDIVGVLDSDRIRNDDLRNKLFDYASIFIFITNWADPRADDLKLRRGTLGEVILTQNGQFTTEVRGMMQTLSHNYVEVFSPECRADFCDTRCKLAIKDYQRDAVVTAVTNYSTFTTAGIEDITVGASQGSHRHWRIVVDAVPDQEQAGFAEIRFFDAARNEITGGTVDAETWQEKARHPSKARDQNPHSSWATRSLQDMADDKEDDQNAADPHTIGQWWRIDFGSAKDVKYIAMMSIEDHVDRTVSSFKLQYTDNYQGVVNTVWQEAGTFSFAFTAGMQTAFWSLASPPDALNYSDSASDVPAPDTGSSTYIGGTVTFKTGPNAGRTVEIVGFNALTQSITLFDGLSYLPQVGDTFMIAQGCDKRFATCKLYENIVNFRGEPDVPGQDALMYYPDAS